MGIRNYEDKIRVYVDLDGVLADFEGAATKMNMKPSQYKLISGSYKDLPLFEGSKDFIKSLLNMGFDVFFLSKIPTENIGSATEKYEWVKNNFGKKFIDKTILSADKGCVGTIRDFLVDDHPEWANAHNFVGTVIKFQNISYEDVINKIWNKINEDLKK